MLQFEMPFKDEEPSVEIIKQLHPLACQPTSFAYLCAVVTSQPFKPILERIMAQPKVQEQLSGGKVVTPGIMLEVAEEMIKKGTLPISKAFMEPATAITLSQPPYTVAVKRLYIEGGKDKEIPEGHRITVIGTGDHGMQYYNPGTGKLYPINPGILTECLFPNAPIIRVTQ